MLSGEHWGQAGQARSAPAPTTAEPVSIAAKVEMRVPIARRRTTDDRREFAFGSSTDEEPIAFVLRPFASLRAGSSSFVSMGRRAKSARRVREARRSIELPMWAAT